MKHILFTNSHECSVAILIKDGGLRKSEMNQYYVEPLKTQGVTDIIAFNLSYEGKKCSVKHAKSHLADLMPELKACGVKHIYVTDGTYFKQLTKEKKTTPHYGYTLPCALDGYEEMDVTIGGNWQACYHNDTMQDTIDLTLKTLAGKINGNHVELGTGIIHTSVYLKEANAIRDVLTTLHQYPLLTLDIEAFSLDFWKAGIGTFAFSWDEHNGVAALCDWVGYLKPIVYKDGTTHYGKQRINGPVRQVLLEFLLSYKGRIIYHNGSYDVKVLIYELFMIDLRDTAGLLEGLEALGNNIHDTKIIVYLATNNTGGNTLGLKPNAHEFAGNYAENDVHDIRRIPEANLLQYNLVDCLSTFYVFKKYHPIMVADTQLQIYNDIMIPSVKVLLQIELTGMPMNMDEILRAQKEMEGYRTQFHRIIANLPTIHKFVDHLRQVESDKCHEKWKKKTETIDHFDYVKFNPASNLQLQDLIYTQLD